MIRLPIGDWTLTKYDAWEGCYDGVEDYVQWALDTCAKYNISVFMDMHGVKGSQNGLTSTGRATKVNWVNNSQFEHYSTLKPNWFGLWNTQTSEYDHVNYDNIQWSLMACEEILAQWGAHSAFAAFEPVSSPTANL